MRRYNDNDKQFEIFEHLFFQLKKKTNNFVRIERKPVAFKG